MRASDTTGRRGRILLVEDDLALGGYLRRALLEGGFEVTHDLDADDALVRVKTEHWDLLITAIELPGMSGLELLARVRELVSDLPVAVLASCPSVDYAVLALRAAAAEFLSKPVDAEDLVAKAAGLIEERRAARNRQQERVLAIGAHPEDVEIGAGGTLAAHGTAGDDVAILTLSGTALADDRARRARVSQRAADIIGARLFLRDLEDTRISRGNPTIALIEEIVGQVNPTIVYVHSDHDRHQDHRNVHRAAMVVCQSVDRVYAYQSPSASVDYRPTHFRAIDDFLGRKLEVIDAFGSSAGLRDYMAPELIMSTAHYWGRYCAGTHAEPFETLRDRIGAGARGHGGGRLAGAV